MTVAQPYNADSSLFGKVRRRAVRLMHRRPARLGLQRPTVSFTFDDVPVSGALEGARILEAAGARGVFYVCAGLFDRDGAMGRYAGRAEIDALNDAGHEIACHTFSHLDCGANDAARVADDADQNAALLSDVGYSMRHFAYPYGEVSPHAKGVLKDRYGSLRAVHSGLVREGSDLNQLPAVGIEGETGEAEAMRWIDQAVARKAWVILYTHDVREAPSAYGCTPDALERIVAHAKASGCDIRTLGEVLDQ
jgi:peptidoglycan/xylan/chitin deacetylase (PgdA/CDA1 family)